MSARRRSFLTLLVVPLVVLLSFVAVGVANASRSPAQHQVVAKPTITISMFAYTTPAKVKHGVKIKIVNKDAFMHTVTSDTAGVFDVSVPAKSTVFFNAPDTPGKYKFHCTVHATMHGVLKVN